MTTASSRGNAQSRPFLWITSPWLSDVITSICLSVCLSVCSLQRPEGGQEGQHEEREQSLLLQGADHRAGAAGGNPPSQQQSDFSGANISVTLSTFSSNY